MHTFRFAPGVTLLGVPGPRAPVVHQLACERLAETDGPAYWIDARNAATTHTLYDCAPSRRSLDALRIARAFTAYQHHSLVASVAERVTDRTSLVVATNVASLYRDPDLPESEQTALLAASLSTLHELSQRVDVPVLATTTDAGALDAQGDDVVDRRVTCTQTREGIRLTGDGVETAGYWGRGYWQTTIPYWVDVCGSTDRFDPIVAAADRGLLDPSFEASETGDPGLGTADPAAATTGVDG